MGYTRPMLLRIQHTWDGIEVGPNEAAAVSITPVPAGGLTIETEAPFHGDPAPGGPPGARPGLWEHEVVELFVVGPDERYLEVELGPHGHHLVLRLEGRRRPVETALPLVFAARIEGARWRGRAEIPGEWLPPRPWTANAFAIHGVGAARRYLCAFPTGGERPDFHRLETFRPFAP